MRNSLMMFRIISKMKAGKKKGKNPHGIKTATYFLALKDFNMVNGFSFDYMHTMLLGNLLHRDFNYN